MRETGEEEKEEGEEKEFVCGVEYVYILLDDFEEREEVEGLLKTEGVVWLTVRLKGWGQEKARTEDREEGSVG